MEVPEEVIVGDLTDVVETKNILPVAQRVKMVIRKAETQATKAKDIKSLKLELRIVDGIANAEGIPQYVNKPVFTGLMDLVYWGDLSVKGRDQKSWWTTKQYLIEFKKFCKALDLDLKEVKVNEDFLEALKDREICVDVQHEEETALDEATGQRVKLGTFKERLKNWRKAE